MPTTTAYDSTTNDLALGNLTPGTDQVGIILVNGYTPNFVTHAKRSDITGEVVGTGYTAGGQTLSGITLTLDTSNNWTLCTATNPVWSGATLVATGAVFFKARGGAASADNLYGYMDFGGSVTSTAAPFTVTSVATVGWFKISKA
jgi:hypothetical protein